MLSSVTDIQNPLNCFVICLVYRVQSFQGMQEVHMRGILCSWKREDGISLMSPGMIRRVESRMYIFWQIPVQSALMEKLSERHVQRIQYFPEQNTQRVLLYLN